MRWTAALQPRTYNAASFINTGLMTMAVAWQVVRLQLDLDAAYEDCFRRTSRDLSDALASSLELPSISEASFGELGRTNPEVRISQRRCSLFCLGCLTEILASMPLSQKLVFG